MFKNKIFITAVIAVVIIAVLGAAKIRLSKTGSDSSALATFEVQRGPLTISVTESGTIKAREQLIIKNEVEGKTSIIYLIPEGTRVKKGELLVELDASSLEDNKIDQEIKVQNAEASYINSTENLAVVENQAKSDIDLAQLTLEFAKQDIKKYLEGEYPNALKNAEADITVAKEELIRATETLKWSQTLYDEKYISQTELQADELSKTKSVLKLELAQNNRQLLVDYTYQRNVAQLQSNVSQAEMALERTNRKARADVVQAQAELKAKQAEFQRQQDKLKKIEEQIVKTKIYAPADGLAIYATSARTQRNVEPLMEGQDVRERQELIYLPTANSSKAEITVHESNLEKIRVGLPAIVTVDALSGKKFFGTIAHIAPLPDAQSMWMNPDLKVYTTEIYLEENDIELRTGMSCQAEIIIEQHQDALYVPIQAVMRIGGKPTVYAQKGKSSEPREVQTGLDNNKMIHIINGLEEGEAVLLTPPLRAAATDFQAASSMSQNIKSAESSSAIDRKVDEKLKETTQRQAREVETDVNNVGKNIDRVGKDNLQQASPEQREDRRKRFENMTPEQKEIMRKRLESMSPEERKKMRQRSKDPNSGN
jgi:HlyD family secretion protein